MPGPITATQQEVQVTAPPSLEAAQQKAGEAIAKLKETGDSEIAEVLIARYEELKMRHEALRAAQKKEASLHPEHAAEETEKDSDAVTSQSFPPQIEIMQNEDDTFECIIGSEGNIKRYALPKLNENAKQSENIVLVADAFMVHAMRALRGFADEFEPVHVDYLSKTLESLEGQKKRFMALVAKHKDAETPESDLALEVSAHLYLHDAVRFLQSSELVVALPHTAGKCHH